MRGMERAFERRGEMDVFPELRAALERIIANEDSAMGRFFEADRQIRRGGR
jgi:hypothetical protein